VSTPGTYTVGCEYLVASNIVTGVASALATQSLAGAVNRTVVVPGVQVAWDNCDCGQLALVVPRHYTSRDFPIDTSTLKTGNCDNTYVVADMYLSLVRCVPGPDEDGNPPTVTDLNRAAEVSFGDMWIMRQTLTCLLRTYYESPPVAGLRIAEWLVTDDVGLGALGGCAGRELHFKVAWWADCGCGD